MDYAANVRIIHLLNCDLHPERCSLWLHDIMSVELEWSPREKPGCIVLVNQLTVVTLFP